MNQRFASVNLLTNEVSFTPLLNKETTAKNCSNNIQEKEIPDSAGKVTKHFKKESAIVQALIVVGAAYFALHFPSAYTISHFILLPFLHHAYYWFYSFVTTPAFKLIFPTILI